jgi:predicted metal-dependent phosphoesterase TrpH
VRIELHCHSTCSDGSVAPEEVARMAAERAAELFCLTDHDTFAGYDATRDALRAGTCTVLRGVELSTYAVGRSVHVLALVLREGDALSQLGQRLDVAAEQRRARLLRICDRLAKLGIALDGQAVLSRTHGRVAGRPDVARALVEAGHCATIQEAFTRWLHDGGAADVAVDRLDLAEALALVRAAGGRAALAHPHAVGSYALVRELFVQHKRDGLEGIEAYYGPYARAQSRSWMVLARELDLVPTGGSDFHCVTMSQSRPVIDVSAKVGARLTRWLQDR